MLKSRKPSALIADPVPLWEKYVIGSRIPTLAIRTAHIQKLAGLPDLHRDPFDRILVAQALAESLMLAIKDGMLAGTAQPSSGNEKLRGLLRLTTKISKLLQGAAVLAVLDR